MSDSTETSIEEVIDHVDRHEPVDPPGAPVKYCPFCGKSDISETGSEIGDLHCNACDLDFDASSGIGGVRHLRAFIVLTKEHGPKLVIGPQHLEHLLETDEQEIGAAGWFGDATVGPAHALSFGKIPHVELDDLGISIEDMEVVLITSSVWHHKQYAKASGYFLHYHPDAVQSEKRKADVFMATRLGLELDVEQQQKTAILEAYLNKDWDAVKTASRMAGLAIKKWSAGDLAADPEYDDEDDETDWKLYATFILSFFFLVSAIVIVTKLFGMW